MAERPTVEQAWDRFHRYGPYGLLAVSVVLAALTADALMSRTDVYVVGVLVLAALALQLWWGRAQSGLSPPWPLSGVYYAAQYALAFVLTWCNPFFSVYAILGYFGAGRLLPYRLARVGMLCTAVTMAGAQCGSGLPPTTAMNWVAFGALYLLHASLAVLFARLERREAEKARTQVETIGELERTNARLEQALAENAGLHAQLLVQAREAGVADERRRLAAEIHDTIAQGLTGIIAQLQVVTSTSESRPETARDHLASALALARHSLGEARRSVHNLVPAALAEDDLPEALEKTVARWTERFGTRVRFTVTGTAEPLHDEVGATLLRIAEEAMANAGRHSGASRIGVTLSYMGDEVTLDVRDDGRGFDPLALPPYRGTDGFGLGGMRSRAERIAGTVTVESEPGHGTAVCARVPLVHHG
ncbi:sensor histidine kinase [Streptomyces sp. DT171]|uniref:sensor histidine kinase n=1 Tax=Streptomyces sp. DT171 TaxID=3416524 RepID=UPI003CE6E98F